MKYRWYHECEKPDMCLGYEETTNTVGWGPFRRQEKGRAQTWETKRVRWTCPVCESVWEWCGSDKYIKGWWSCQHRPEVWREYQ